MIRQGPVQEIVTDMNMPPSSLPPLNNLPQWSRINTLDKARYPKPFLRDRLQPLPQTDIPGGGERKDSEDSGSDRDLEVSDAMSNPAVRIQHLEKSMNFLRVQHQEILSSLHEEIDRLKRENKELHFKVIMISKHQASTEKRGGSSLKGQPSNRNSASKDIRESSATSKASESKPPVNTSGAQEDPNEPVSEHQSQVSDEKLEELKIIFLEEEIKELKKALREEQHKNHYLTQLIETAEKKQLQKQKELQQAEPTSHIKPASAGLLQPVPPSSAHSSQAARAASASSAPPAVAAAQLPFNATNDPLLVNITNQPPRPPTLSECEIIIRHLLQANDKQAHELNQLKSDLRDVLYSHKWTPDAYLLAKAYIAEDDARENAENGKLPKIPMKQPSRKLPDIAYIQKDTVSLPALKQTMGNKAIERRKRTQILQKARLRREITGTNEVGEGY